MTGFFVWVCPRLPQASEFCLSIIYNVLKLNKMIREAEERFTYGKRAKTELDIKNNFLSLLNNPAICHLDNPVGTGCEIVVVRNDKQGNPLISCKLFENRKHIF